jgi:hypothetical protein
MNSLLVFSFKDVIFMKCQCVKIKLPRVIVSQQFMRFTRWIVLPLLPKALYQLGFFEGIVKSGKTIRQITWMIYQVDLRRFCIMKINENLLSTEAPWWLPDVSYSTVHWLCNKNN